DWAVRLYDEYLRRPDLIRLANWSRLECSPTGYLAETHEDYDEPKLAAIAEAQSAGRVRSGNPFDIMAIVIAMSTASRRSAMSTRQRATNLRQCTKHDGPCCVTVSDGLRIPNDAASRPVAHL